MYNLEAVRRKIKRDGIDKLILDLSSETLSDDAKRELSSCNILTNGYPNLSVIYSLA